MQKRTRYFALRTPEQAVLAVLSEGGMTHDEIIRRARLIVNLSPMVYALLLRRMVESRQIQQQDTLYRLFPPGYEYGPDGGDAA